MIPGFPDERGQPCNLWGCFILEQHEAKHCPQLEQTEANTSVAIRS